jgi:predicted GH43/DUF377 family glycosyl hydrolase
MWISYCALGALDWLGGEEPPWFAHHHLLATPQEEWEASRIGGGTVSLPPPDGWLTFYHGVHVRADGGRCYQTGALLLNRADPRQVLARTPQPIFGPEMPEERVGVVGNVVFPTAVEERGGGLDVYNGMADSRIGCAHLPSVVGTALSDAA